MTMADAVDAASCVWIGHGADALHAIHRSGVELAVWRRDADPTWAGWLAGLPPDIFPAGRFELASADAATVLASCFDAGGTAPSQGRAAFVADVARLVALFASLVRTPRVRLRLEAVTDDGCRRWHRDCVPLRLICTYRGPGSMWVPAASGPSVLSRPDDDAPQAMSLQTADVALFKGCGWPGQPHDGGIVHRSPRIAGTGMARLVLVLDAACPPIEGRRS